MDWLPPGGLERVFAQYDRIVAHHHTDPPPHVAEPPPTAPPVATEAKPVSRDEPPWQSPPNDLFDRMEAGEQRLFGKQKQSAPAADGLFDRMDAGEQRLKEHIDHPSGATFKQDEEGLDNAYLDKTSAGVYYDPSTRTEYVKGTKTAHDWYDDFTKIPFWGDTRNSERYQQADAAYEDLQAHGQPVDRVVGHSLGGSVALQLQRDKGIPASRTFGAPVLDLKRSDYGKSERYRHPIDPVSVLDRGATWGKFKVYPHTYTDFEDRDKVKPWGQ